MKRFLMLLLTESVKGLLLLLLPLLTESTIPDHKPQLSLKVDFLDP